MRSEKLQKMKRLIVATKNKGKIREIEEILKDFGVQVLTMSEVGICENIEENGTTFEENAKIKAKYVYNRLIETKNAGDVGEFCVFADDSGLEVDYLGGRPGVYSARYAGENATDQDRVDKLLSELEGVPYEKRTARFVCAAAFIGEGIDFIVRGTFEGFIAYAPKGSNGFGYDPIVYIPEYEKTVAELEPEIKNKISHRGKALRKMVEKLEQI